MPLDNDRGGQVRRVDAEPHGAGGRQRRPGERGPAVERGARVVSPTRARPASSRSTTRREGKNGRGGHCPRRLRARVTDDHRETPRDATAGSALADGRTAARAVQPPRAVARRDRSNAAPPARFTRREARAAHARPPSVGAASPSGTAGAEHAAVVLPVQVAVGSPSGTVGRLSHSVGLEGRCCRPWANLRGHGEFRPNRER